MTRSAQSTNQTKVVLIVQVRPALNIAHQSIAGEQSHPPQITLLCWTGRLRLSRRRTFDSAPPLPVFISWLIVSSEVTDLGKISLPCVVKRSCSAHAGGAREKVAADLAPRFIFLFTRSQRRAEKNKNWQNGATKQNLSTETP
jgi:hypothetical protein